MILVMAGLFGLVVEHFLNVVVHRVPLHRSVMWSFFGCLSCGAAISAWDNVRVVSYLTLRGAVLELQGAHIAPLIPLSRPYDWAPFRVGGL